MTLLDVPYDVEPRIPAVQSVLLKCARDRDARQVSLRDGEALFRCGDTCDQFFVMMSGVLRVQVASRNGRQIVLYRVRQGELCMATTTALFAARPFHADGFAEAGSKVLVLPRSRFQSLMANDAAFREFVLGALGKSIASVMDLLQDVAFEGVNNRLAQLLLERSGTTADVRDTHERLALELGSAREVVSRRLKEFERAGWVRLTRGRIEVLDAGALERIERGG